MIGYDHKARLPGTSRPRLRSCTRHIHQPHSEINISTRLLSEGNIPHVEESFQSFLLVKSVRMSINKGDEMEGVETSQEIRQNQPLLTEEEKRVLDVYDRLEELQQEIALLKAQGVLSQGKRAEL
jgi:hypothetical protein